MSVALSLCLTACGDAKPPAPTPSPSAAAPRPAAVPRPEDQLPAPQCPPRATTAAAGPDIVGLRLGMGFDEALNHARCAVQDGTVGFSPRWYPQLRPGRVTLERQMFTVQRGDTVDCSFRQLGDAQKCGLGRREWRHIDEQITVAAPGLPGRQTVQALWRQQHWKPGQMPSRDAVLTALRDKYGPESALRADQHGTVVWRQDAAGRRLVPPDPRYDQCHGPAARATSSQGWREGCGFTVTADLVPPRDNPALVQSLYVGLMHQEQLLRHGDALQAELDRVEADRRRSELQQAGGNTPKL